MMHGVVRDLTEAESRAFFEATNRGRWKKLAVRRALVRREPRIMELQEFAILFWIKTNVGDPLHLPIEPAGVAGVKAECFRSVRELRRTRDHRLLFMSRKSFDLAWDRLRSTGRIRRVSA